MDGEEMFLFFYPFVEHDRVHPPRADRPDARLSFSNWRRKEVRTARRQEGHCQSPRHQPTRPQRHHVCHCCERRTRNPTTGRVNVERTWNVSVLYRLKCLLAVGLAESVSGGMAV